jgi:probable F420-dependent oxidoreductase
MPSPVEAALLRPGEVVWGMQLPVQAQSTLFAEPWERDAGPKEIEAVARAADESGFYYVAVCDHFAIPRRLVGAMGATWYDTMTTLAYLAAKTSRTRLLTHVLVIAHRHPLVMAKSIATLDALSGGRVIVGVGAGHVPEEFALFGHDFESRGKLLDEGIEALAACLEEEYPSLPDGAMGLDGSWALSPRPVQEPRPAIWVGGSSPAAVRRAARLGDGWLPQGTPRKDLPPLIEMLVREREIAGRGPIDLGTITEWLYVGTPAWDLGRPCVTGSPAELAESLAAYLHMGVQQLQVRFPSRSASELADQVRVFGEQVGPLLRQEAAARQ